MSAEHPAPDPERDQTRATRQQQERLSLVNEIARSMLGDRSTDALIRSAVDNIHRRLPGYRAAFSTVDDDGRVTIAYAVGPDDTPAVEDRTLDLTLPTDWAARFDPHQLLRMDDVERDVVPERLRSELVANGSRAFLDAPIRRSETRMGSLSLDSATPHAWTEHEQAALREAADFLLVALRDAERRQQLAESEAKFRAVAEQSDINISLVRSGGDVVYANSGMARMTGYTVEELLQLDFLELVHPDFRKVAAERAARRFTGEALGEPLELKIVTKDGQERWLEFRGSTIELDGVPTLLSSGIDITLRKQAEELVLESEARLRTVLEHIFDGIGVFFDGKVVYVNSRLCAMFGYEASELIGSSGTQLLPLALRDCSEALAQTVRDGDHDPAPHEYEAVRKNGTTFPIEALSQRVPFGDGFAILTAARDLTDRRRQERAIREAEAKYRNLVENSLAGVYVIQNDRFVYVNPKMAETLGYTQAELLALPNFVALATEASRPVVLEQIRKRLEDGVESVHYDFDVVHKDGRTVHLEVHGGRTTYLSRPAIIGTCLDVTEREAATNAIKASEARFRTLFEQAPIGIVLAGPDSTMLRVNHTFCEMLGYTEPELVGRSFVDITHREDPGGTPDSAKRVLEDAAFVTRLTKRYRRKDGELVYAETTVSVTRNESGEVMYAVAMIEDITDRRKLEEQLLQMQRLESVGQLAGGVAHNFNNALTAIYGYSELLARRFDPTDPALKDLEQIQRVAERSASLTRQLLTFSRREEVRPTEFCLNDAVQATRDLLSPLIGDHVRIRLRLDRALPDVVCDRTQIEQVITNLVLNARDAMSNGGSLTIVTEAVPVDAAASRTNPEAVPGRYVQLTVTDTGTGMDEETLDRVFEPFFTTKEPGEGVGLGLAMVHGAVKQNGGFITAQSELGVGSTFTLYLPERAPAAGAEEPTTWQAPANP